MLDTPNNHFWDISKFVIPKIRPFYNLMGVKITKKLVKMFSAQISEYTAHPKQKKKYTK